MTDQAGLPGFAKLKEKADAMDKAEKDSKRSSAAPAGNKYQAVGYERDEVVSAWIKEMRFRNYDEALWWLVVMFRCGESAWYALKRLAIFAAEDVHEVQTLTEATKAFNEVNGLKVDWTLVEKLLTGQAEEVQTFVCAMNSVAAAEKAGGDWNTVMRVFDFIMRPEALRFWEDPKVREFQRKWWNFEDKFTAKTDFPKIPIYAVDTHTKRGRENKKVKLPYGWKYSGTKYGQRNMMDEFEKHGKLLGDGPVNGSTT